VNNFLYIKDNILSKEDCNNIIKVCDKNLLPAHDLGYEYYDIKKIDLLKFLVNKSNFLIKDYLKLYPQLDLVSNKFGLTNIRFKKFNKNKSFGNWHSEHCIDYPFKILNIMYYLSDHNCGTLFYNDDLILSKKGRVAIFPSYFTHTHKGQVCPDGKIRYILTGYFEFIKQYEKI